MLFGVGLDLGYQRRGRKLEGGDGERRGGVDVRLVVQEGFGGAWDGGPAVLGDGVFRHGCLSERKLVAAILKLKGGNLYFGLRNAK